MLLNVTRFFEVEWVIWGNPILECYNKRFSGEATTGIQRHLGSDDFKVECLNGIVTFQR